MKVNMKITKRKFSHNDAMTGLPVLHASHSTGHHVYHPTKGWRKIGRDPSAGYAKVDALMARLP